MTGLFAIIEQSGPSVFMRESLWAFPAALIGHAVGMAILAGGGAVVALRFMGVARQIPVGALAPVYRWMWGGFWLALASGLALLLAYPAKGLTNPVFGLKFALIAGAVALLYALRAKGEVSAGWVKPAAAGVLLLWAGAIFAGRFLAYTHSVLMVS